MDRRSFLSFLTVATGAVAGALVGVPLVGRILAPLRTPPATEDGYQTLGALDSFVPGQPVRVTFPVTVRDGWAVTTQERAAWVIKGSDGRVAVLSTVCPHLGCSVKWEARKEEFGCPCHESGFAATGERRHGPARRGLDALPTRIVGNDLQVRWLDFVANVADQRPVGGA